MTTDPEQTYDALRMPADDVTLEEESDEVKGVRLLQTLRAFIACPQKVMPMVLDGHWLVVLQSEPPDPAIVVGTPGG